MPSFRQGEFANLKIFLTRPRFRAPAAPRPRRLQAAHRVAKKLPQFSFAAAQKNNGDELPRDRAVTHSRRRRHSVTLSFMDEQVLALLDDFSRFSTLDASARASVQQRAAWLAVAPPDLVAELLEGLAKLDDDTLGAADELLASVALRIAQSRRQGRGDISLLWLSQQVPARLAALYRQLPATARARGGLLMVLASGGTPEELALFCDLLVGDPPGGENDVLTALAPLFQLTDYDATSLFPRLLAALAHPTLAAAVLDLANFLTRQGLVPDHPASEQRAELMRLLGELAHRLQRLEEQPEETVSSAEELTRTVSHGVALAVALCDALALIGDRAAISKLHLAMDLRHRRIRTEAAAALARLGEKSGQEELVKLASEPVARLRVLHYAEEMGIADKLEPEYLTPEARAEAELALWLAEPANFGIPPTECELVDKREQYWPSYEEPVECFLFRFTYRLTTAQGEAIYSNIGIAGPLVRAVTADLADLPVDDTYALFAGWHAEHEDIFEVEAHLLSESQRVEVARLERRLRDAQYEAIRPAMLCYFFSEKSLVGRVNRAGVEGVALASPDEILWFPANRGARSLTPLDVACLYRGRRLLREFNG
jgi:hypothetical protein